MISSELTVVLGGACLPHITMRMYTAGSARQVRRSMSWAVPAVALFVLIITVVGFGATALIGREAIAAEDPQGNTAYLLGSRAAFGADVSTAETLLFTTVTAAIFLTVLASVAGMILACANSLAHDVFAHGRKQLSPRREMTLARVSAAAVGIPAILLATLVQHHSLQPLVTLSFCLGASAIAPAARLQPVLAAVHPGGADVHAHRRLCEHARPDDRYESGVRVAHLGLPRP